jgi:sulfur carrier protein
VSNLDPNERAAITVNGKSLTLKAGNVIELLERLGYGTERGGIAVALNGRVVARGSWGEQAIGDGDEVEIVGAVQGG